MSTTNLSMTSADLPMIWSIYTNPSEEVEWEDEEWDISANVSDGEYNVEFHYINKIGKGSGIKVVNGEFLIAPTIKAIKDAVDDVNYWGLYIEGLYYSAENKSFIVEIGS